MDCGDESAKDGVENAPGIPDHHVDGIGSSELTDARDGNKSQHQRSENIEDGTKQCVKKTEDDNGECINDVRDQKHSDRNRARRIACDDVPERKIGIGLGLLLKLRHPIDEHVAGAGAVADKTRDGIEGTVYIPKYCGPIRDNHGDDEILDRSHSKRLKIAAT